VERSLAALVLDLLEHDIQLRVRLHLSIVQIHEVPKVFGVETLRVRVEVTWRQPTNEWGFIYGEEARQEHLDGNIKVLYEAALH
jgi:hypothetical protein